MNPKFPFLKPGCYIKGDMGPTGPKGDIGPQGPMGPQGIAETITLGNIKTTDATEEAQIIDRKTGFTHVFDFILPKGEKGKDGSSVSILGSYNTKEELQKEHPIGAIGDSYLVGENLYVWDDEMKEWKDVGIIKGPTGPMGPQGKEGPPGPLDIPTAIFFKFNENTNGEEIKSLARLPFNVKIGDEDNSYFVLNQKDATITFLKSGTYYVHFVVLAHPINGTQYKDDHDMIAIGFTKVIEDSVYAGGSMWDNNKETVSIVGNGIVNLPYDYEKFDLVNFSKYPIYLDSPPSAYTYTSSNYINPVIQLTIQKIK